jgi:hypothetical protein
MRRLLWAAALMLLIPVAAEAQQLGIRGGVSARPPFGFVGFRIESPRRNLWITYRFTFDVGAGEKRGFFYGGAIIWRPRTEPGGRQRSWSPYFGGAVALMYSRIRSDYLHDGYGLLVGIEHRNRISFEIQYNVWSVPRFYFVIEYRLREGRVQK